MNTIDIEALTHDERSILLYAETCLVDRGGLLCGARMNGADMAALKQFEADGALEFGRIPFKLLGNHGGEPADTHWVTFHEPAWQAAHALRRKRSENIGPIRKRINEALTERAA